MSTAPASRPTVNYSTMDIALMAILGVAFGLLNLVFSSIWTVANASFGIIGGALIQPFFIPACLAAWLIRKPGVFLITYLVTSLTNMLAGNSAGILQLYWGLAGGLAGELAFLAFGYRPSRIVPAILLGCVLYIPFSNIVTYFAFGWSGTPLGLFILSLIVAIVANIVQSGLVAIGLGKALARTGLLRSYTAVA